jgi:membrane fusion protein (multidrug efflux system)
MIALLILFLGVVAGCEKREPHAHAPHHTIVVTTPVQDDVTSIQQYVCQIRSCRHIDMRALESGYLEKIQVSEGQQVAEGDLVFQILPTLFQARYETDVAEVAQVQIELDNTIRLFEKNVVVEREVALIRAKLAKAKAKLDLSKAELNFTSVRAPFSGIIDRFQKQQGSFVDEADILTTLSDNSTVWVYFNVPEKAYLEYMADMQNPKDQRKIELRLANGSKFDQVGKIGAIEAEFNNQTGNIPFRADFPNPNRLLRHGQTGTILISTVHPNSIVIPQRAVFEILSKRYVYVVDENNIIRQREIVVESELDDIYLIQDGLDVNDKIVLEGTRQVRDGDEVEFEYRAPSTVLVDLKYHAE